MGTLLPQIRATFVSLNPGDYEAIATQEGALPASYALDALLVVIGTISTLLYFYFSAGKGGPRFAGRRGPVVHILASFGKVFIMFTFGALYATAAISRISLLIDRARFIIETVQPYIPTVP